MSPRWDQELTKSESFFFFITDAISFYDGSSQSNSDSGGSTSTFLGHGPRSLFRSGSNVFSSGTAQLLPLRISNSLIVPFLSASCESEWFILQSVFYLLPSPSSSSLFYLPVLTLPAPILHRQSTLLSPSSPLTPF